MEVEKIDWIVSLRTFATLAVVLLHVVGGWIGNSWELLMGARMVLNKILIQVFVRWAVPCFVMISGALLLNLEKQIDMKKINRYIVRMLGVLLSFGLLYCFMELLAKGYRIPVEIVILGFKNLLEGNSWAHMWYVYMIIGLYMITPLLRAFIKEADEVIFNYTLVILFIFGIVRPTANNLFHFEMAQIIPISSPYLFYYLMGSYVVNKKISYRMTKWIFAAGIFGLVSLLTLKIGEVDNIVGPDNIFVCAYSVSLFAIASNSKFLVEISKNKIIQNIAKYSFGIYLIHPFFLNVLNKMFNIYPDILPIAIGEGVFFIFALVGAYLSTWILCKIKFLKRILI